MFRFPHDGSRTVKSALGIDQIARIEQLSAVLALVAPGLLVAAVGTGPQYVPVGKKHVRRFTVELVGRVLGDVSVGVELQQDVLRDLRLPFGRGSAEAVERDVEPLVHPVVNLVVPIAQFAGRNALLPRACFGGGAVLIGAADVERLIATHPAEPREDIGRQHLDDRTQVGNVVHVRKRGCDKTFHSSAL